MKTIGVQFVNHVMLALLHDGSYATLHDGTYELDDSGMLIEDQDIPVIARAPVGADGVIRFTDLPQCHAQHVAVWSAHRRLLGRFYCFPVEGYPEWAQRREIPVGGTVEVQIHLET